MGWIDLAVFALLAVAVFVGFRKGLVQEIVGIIALVAAFVAAVVLHQAAAGWLKGMAPAIPGHIAPTAGFMAAFLAVFLAITIAGWLLSKIIRATPLDLADKLGGMAVGLIKGALIISVLLLLLAMVPLPKDASDRLDGSAAIRSMRKVAPWVYQHTKGLWPKAREMYQDFQKQPEPKKVQQLKPI